jgi:hypothetical protein
MAKREAWFDGQIDLDPAKLVQQEYDPPDHILICLTHR